jgi:hypothetical protein
MTHDSTLLGSMSSLPSHVFAKTVNGTPLPVVSHNTLCTPKFHVSSVSHVPQLHLQLFSAGQITDHCSSFLSARLLIIDVVSFLILMLVLFRIIAL